MIHPAVGLKLIQGATSGDIEDVDAQLLAELGADVTLRARFRVGVFNGRASIESGSVITITGPRILGSYTSRRSILSKQAVLNGEGFTPFVGDRYDVHDGKYRLAMDSLFNNYISLVSQAGVK